MTLSSVMIPIASIKLKRTKMLIDKSKIHNPRNEPIKLTGKATAGTITAFKLPKKKYIISVTSTKAMANVFHISKILALTKVLQSNATSNFNPSGKVFSIFFILFFILWLNSTMEASLFA